jgi:hypothetical protein
MHKPLIGIAVLVLLVSSSACFTVTPPTAATQADCENALREFAKIRPDAFSLDEWADWKWAKALRFNGLPVGPDLRSQTISKSAYVKSITQGQPVAPYFSKGLEHSFLSWSHGKAYIGWEDTRRDETADFRRHDRNSDGWVTRDECALSILPPPSLG